MAEKVKKEVKNPALVQAVKAVAVLVIICLVCALLLALCNDLLYVSDEEKLSRAMKKIYPNYGDGDKDFNEHFKLDSATATNAYGTITEVKKAEDGAYVISAKGGGGYKGTITLYVVVGNATNGKDVVIKAWTVKEHDGETFLGNITDTHKSTWYVNKSITAYNDAAFALSNNKVSGTTLSSTAINNAIKAACVYCIDVLKLVSTPESEARDAVVALLGADYDGYTFTNVADKDGFSEFAVGEQALSFLFEGTKADSDTLEAYVYGEDDNRQIVVVTSGLTHDERLAADVVAQSDNASDEIVEKVKSLSYFEYLVHKSYAGFEFAGMDEVDADFAGANGTVNKIYLSTDGAIVIEATGNGGYEGGTVTINVVIADNVIKGWWIVSNEKQSFLPNIINSADAQNWYVGTAIDGDLTLGNNKVSGTTMSSTAINNAINTACEYARNLAE